MQYLIPEIEADIPVPQRTKRELPEFSPNEEIRLRAATIKHISDISGQPVIPSVGHQVEAEVLAHDMIKSPDKKPDFSKYANETMAWLAGMVAESNVQLVDELSELKMYVVNKLIYEVEHAKDSKSRIAALGKLGEVDGVDAFKKRTETTISVKPIEEIEKELMRVLDNIEYSVVDYDITPQDQSAEDITPEAIDYEVEDDEESSET